MKPKTAYLRQMNHYHRFKKMTELHQMFDDFLFRVKPMGGRMYDNDNDFINNINSYNVGHERTTQFFMYLVNLDIIKRTEEGKVYLTDKISLLKSHKDFIKIVDGEMDTNQIMRGEKIKKLKKKKVMKLNIKILVGIPGCGKSTWSKSYILENPNTKRINRDDLRNMLDAGKLTDGNENFLRVLRLEMVKMCLALDKHVVLDDTNCYASKLEETIYAIRLMASQMNKEIEIEIVDFDVDVDTCVERNKNREEQVQETAIYHMKNAKDEIDFDSLLIDKYEKI